MQTKHLFLTAILLVFSVLVVAGPVDPMRALEVAEQFAPQQAKGKGIKSKTAPEQSYEIVYTHRMPNSDRAAFYVVKLGEKGFVIISADDVANPILGYSYTNSWPTSISAEGDTILPLQVLSYLNDMALQIETAIEKYPNLDSSEEWNNVGQKTVRKSRTRKSADALPDSVGPLLTTTWGQGQYYNALCPEDANGEDGHVPTGCVATAMAQIINYWGQKEEIKTRGIHSYDSQYGNLTVNYDSTSYDFANMPDALTAESTPEQINAVAKLMYECGVAVNMQYDTWASGAHNEDVVNCVVNHFRFSPEIKECFRYDYSDEEWFLALKNSLACNSPIYYSGVNDIYAGHAFICDGYNNMDYFHINFGWDGYCDGWYNLSAVSTEIGFSHYQSAILSFYPKDSSILYGQNNTIISISGSTDVYNSIKSGEYFIEVVMHFVSSDSSKQLVLDIIDFQLDALKVYDGITTDEQYLVKHLFDDEITPVVSTRNALTIKYIIVSRTEGFHLRVTPESSCRAVSNVVTQFEDSTMYVSWQENGESTEWLVEYGLKGFELGTGIQHIVQTNNIGIDQAVGNDAYEIKIQPVCDTLYDDCVYSVVVNERKYWSDVVESEPEGYYLDDDRVIHVSTAEGLAWISKLVENDTSSNYLQNDILIEADIDLGGYSWFPILNWKGKVDGKGHVISNMHIDIFDNVNRDVSCLGFFSYFNGSSIENIGFKHASIKGDKFEKAGTIAGSFNFSKICNSFSVECEILTIDQEAGGLFGYSVGSSLCNCYATGEISSWSRTSGISGGLVGDGQVTMYNCYSSVDVCKNLLVWRGLLCAYPRGGSYENCYAEVDNYSTEFWGHLEQKLETKNLAYFSRGSDGIARILTEGSKNYTLGDIDLITVLNHGVEKYNSPMLKTWILDSITGLPKFGDYYNVKYPNVSDIKLQNIVHNNEDAVVISWTENGEAYEWQIKYLREGQTDDSARYINTFSTKDTLRNIELGHVYKFYVRPLYKDNDLELWGEYVTIMVDKPYWDEIVTTQPEGYIVDEFGNVKISSAEGLVWLSVCSNGYHGQHLTNYDGKIVEIIADLDLKGYRWRPIGQHLGDQQEIYFKGILNGNNHTIFNLYCNEIEKDYGPSGLIGMAKNATVLNVNLLDCSVTGPGGVGGLIGSSSQCFINNCHVSGIIKGKTHVGGLLGSGTNVWNSSAKGQVYGDQEVGGLIGQARDIISVQINNCYAKVDVSRHGEVLNNEWLGGLIGTLESQVNNCYTSGDVEECISTNWGILVSGSIFGDVYSNSKIDRVYTSLEVLPWYASSNSECDTCISNIGLFDDKGIFQEVLNKSSNHPNNLLDALNAWVDANNSEGQYLHWVADTVNVNGGYPIFRQEPIALPKYIITFCNDDGTILQQDTLELGKMPEYRGGIPAKDSTEQYNYNFIGWYQELAPATKDVTYYAQYESTLNQYEITFYDWDGSVLQSGNMAYGEWPTYYNSDPWRESNAQYTYTFLGWSPELSMVTGHQSYYAQYESTLNQYEITFYNWNGELLQSSMVNYGEWPNYYNSEPTREADAQYTYNFNGWSPQLDWVTGHQSYYAQYESTLNQYEINFYDWDGTLLQSNMVNYGEWPMYDNSDPWRESDAQYTYTFLGWSPQLDWVIGAANYYAQYEATLNQYEINFYDWNGTLLQSTMVNYGEWPAYYNSDPWRESDAQYTYTFTGWSPQLDIVTGHQSYYAQYEATLNQYEVTFYNWDGEVLQSTMVDYGAMPEYFGVTPTKPEDDQYVYTFSGWEPEITIVVAYAEYTAQYDATDKVTTVIENTQSDEVKTYKILRNNKIFIIRGDKVYSILGHVIEDWMPLGL